MPVLPITLLLLLALPAPHLAFPILSPPLVNYRAVNGKWQPQAPPRGDAEGVKFLGEVATAAECSSLAVKAKAYSYTWHAPEYRNSSFSSLCYGTTSSYFEWFPFYDTATTSGRVWWGCTTAADCAMNGECRNGRCECRKGWVGDACTSLDLRRTRRDTGYHGTLNGRNMSSWGGPVVRGEDNTYHMFASEMEGHCGLDAWGANSAIIRAVSTTGPLGPYKKVDHLFSAFSHEADAKVAPDGTIGLFFTRRYPNTWPVCTCTDGHTDPSCHQYPDHPDTDPTVLSIAKSPSGPWSEPVVVMKNTVSDTNLTPLILRNGSLVGLYRSFYLSDDSTTFSHIHWVTASNWTDPATYRYNISVADTALPLNGPTEDPFLYRTSDGLYHAIFHNMYGCYPCGGHAYSTDGGRKWCILAVTRTMTPSATSTGLVTGWPLGNDPT
eukprot:Sspe_Gene.30713::Locus_15181_Transcript_2_2_Confidence_0.667_Length_1641::g.30713::m.30713